MHELDHICFFICYTRVHAFGCDVTITKHSNGFCCSVSFNKYIVSFVSPYIVVSILINAVSALVTQPVIVFFQQLAKKIVNDTADKSRFSASKSVDLLMSKFYIF